jgi:hypothetical protein
MRVLVNIATHKKREGLLKRSLISLLRQNSTIDLLTVVFNDYGPPQWFKDLEEGYPYLQGLKAAKDLKAGSKFTQLSEAKDNDIYLTCDDDIFYPANYVKYITDLVLITGGPIAFDGTIINKDGEISLKVPFFSGNASPRSVNLGGSGTIAFPVQIFKGFKPGNNYADIDFAAYAQKLEVSFICPVRADNWIKPLDGHWETSIQRGDSHIKKLRKVVEKNPFKLFERRHYDFTDFGGWSIDFGAFKHILGLDIGFLVEFGSGGSTKYLNRYLSVLSVEEDVIFHEKSEIPEENKILAPISGGWYDLTTEDLKRIKKADAYLVDGPKGENRVGILDNLNLLNKKAIFIVDDCQRKEDLQIARQIGMTVKRPISLNIFGEKTIAII